MRRVFVFIGSVAVLCMAQQPCQPGPGGKVCPDTSIQIDDRYLCLEKIYVDPADMPQWCQNFKTATDSQFFLMNINLKKWGSVESLYDSAHLAWLRDTGEAMFAEYELFYWPDTARATWPLQREGYGVEYGYPMMIMTKATAMALQAKSYVARIWGTRPAEVGLPRFLSGSKIPWSGIESKTGYDAQGRLRSFSPGNGLKLFPANRE